MEVFNFRSHSFTPAVTIGYKLEREREREEASTLTLSDPMSDLVRHYDFPVPDAFLDLQPFPIHFFCHPHTAQLLLILGGKEVGRLLVIILQF
jgi:hypothetical protein